jgi:hypothetical protein
MREFYQVFVMAAVPQGYFVIALPLASSATAGRTGKNGAPSTNPSTGLRAGSTPIPE